MCLQSGRELVLQALEYLESNTLAPARVGIIFNSIDARAPPALLERVLVAVMQLPSRRAKIPGVQIHCSADLMYAPSRAGYSWANPCTALASQCCKGLRVPGGLSLGLPVLRCAGFLQVLFSEAQGDLLLGLFLVDDDDSLQAVLDLAAVQGLNRKALEAALGDAASPGATAARLKAESHLCRCGSLQIRAWLPTCQHMFPSCLLLPTACFIL